MEKENNIEKLKKDLDRALKKQNETIKTHLENLKQLKKRN